MKYTTERYRKMGIPGRYEEKIKLGREERVNRLPSRYTIQTRVIDIEVKGVLASKVLATKERRIMDSFSTMEKDI